MHANHVPIIIISIYQISVYQFSRVLIGSRNLEYPWIFTVLRTEGKIELLYFSCSMIMVIAMMV